MSGSDLLKTKMLIALRCHLLNPLWHDRMTRRATRQRESAAILCNFFSRHNLKAAKNVGDCIPVPDDFDWHIWTIWLQGEENAPAIVRNCLNSIRRFYPDRLVVLDSRNIADYIDLPPAVMEKYHAGQIRNCHFADICRIELLHRYGGIWLDATCLMTAPIPEQILHTDFFMYTTEDTFVQNCFISARRGSRLLEAWRAMVLDYWLKEDSAISYFMHQIMFRALVTNDAAAAVCFDAMPKIDQGPTHRLWWSDADKPYCSETLDELAGQGIFFQKTTWKNSEKAVSGSFREWIIRGGDTAGCNNRII